MTKIEKQQEAIEWLRLHKEDIDLYKINKLSKKFGVSIYKMHQLVDYIKKN